MILRNENRETERLTHTRSCPQLSPADDNACTCGLEWRIQLATEKTMHAAWRKRAEEAESKLLSLTAERLHQQIMNLPCKCPESQGHAYGTYAIGHRDARHAAAELVLSLALIREDDSLPLDEAWLRSVGFEGPHFRPEALRLYCGRLKLTFYEGWNLWLVASDGVTSMRMMDDIKTRGDLRRVAAALKIPLREGAEDV